MISSDSNFDICSASSASKTGLPVMDVVVRIVVAGDVGIGLVCWWMGLMGCCGCTRGTIACVANFGNASC